MLDIGENERDAIQSNSSQHTWENRGNRLRGEEDITYVRFEITVHSVDFTHDESDQVLLLESGVIVLVLLVVEGDILEVVVVLLEWNLLATGSR